MIWVQKLKRINTNVVMNVVQLLGFRRNLQFWFWTMFLGLVLVLVALFFT
jgi:hypothetical protein